MIANLAVVGGGVIGSFTAYEAVRLHPDWRVLLLERSAIGAGATTWSAGVSFPLGATPRHRELVRASAIGYATLRDTPVGSFLRPVQMIYALDRANLPAFRDRVVGPPLRSVTTAERQRVMAIFPDLRLGEREEMVTHDGHGFVVQARLVAEALVAAIGGRAEIQLGQQVNAIETDGDSYRLLAEHGEWSAQRVILACGPWTPPPVRPVPLAAVPGSRRKRVAALHARLPVSTGDPLVYFVDDDLFVLPLAAETALVSFYRDEWDTDPDASDGRPSADDLRVGTAALERRSASAAAAVIGGRAFCDLYTENRLPVVTSEAAIPGVAAVRGGSGSGVRLAPALAAEALRAVTATARLAPAAGRRNL